jgi:hypothetical protein
MAMRHEAIGLLLCVVSTITYAQSKNERLFEQCRGYERYRADPSKATPADATASLSCMNYIAGAAAVHNLGTQSKCKHSDKPYNEIIADYLAYTRRGGFLEQPQEVIVFTLLEVCYCGVEHITRQYCPALAPAQPK